jgi:uncharacterized membrane protein
LGPSAWIPVIEFVGALIIAGYMAAAVVSLVRVQNIDQARLLIAEGVITSLSFKLAATLLKTILLQSWEQILMFTAIFAIRTLLKHLFAWQRMELGGRPSWTDRSLYPSYSAPRGRVARASTWLASHWTRSARRTGSPPS